MKKIVLTTTMIMLLSAAYYAGAQQEKPADLQQVWTDVKGRKGTLDTDRAGSIFIVQIDPDAEGRDMLAEVGRDHVVVRTVRDKKYAHVFIPFNQIRLVQRN